MRGITELLGAELGDASPDSDAERAALLWSAQIRRFAEAVSQTGGARTLEFEALVINPAMILSAIARMFGSVVDHATINRVVAGSLFNTYSKNPAIAFDNQSRLALRAATAHALQDEITAASRWLEGQGISPEALCADLAQADLLIHDQIDS